MKKQNLVIAFIISLCSFIPATGQSGVGIEVKPLDPEVITKEDIAFISRELRNKHLKEKKSLENNLKDEKSRILDQLEREEKELFEKSKDRRIKLLNRIEEEEREFLKKERSHKSRIEQDRKALYDSLNKEEKTLKEKIRRERKAIEAKIRKEKEDLKKRQREEVESEVKRRKTQRVYKNNSRKNRFFFSKKNKTAAEEKVEERRKLVKKVKKTERYVNVVTTEDDPLLITTAEVRNGETEFLRLNIDIEYKLKLLNQTPKIINTASVTWERKIPYSPVNTTISRTTNISKPIVPYEERLLSYNEADPERNGEVYRVKVERVTFEDGSQWINEAN